MKDDGRGVGVVIYGVHGHCRIWDFWLDFASPNATEVKMR